MKLILDSFCPFQILDTPSLLAEGSSGVKKNIFKQKPQESDASTSSCCSWWCDYNVPKQLLPSHSAEWYEFQALSNFITCTKKI